MQANLNFKLVIFLLISTIPYYGIAKETTEIPNSSTSSEEITIKTSAFPTNEDIQPLLKNLEEYYKEKTWGKDNWGFMKEKFISPIGKEYSETTKKYAPIVAGVSSGLLHLPAYCIFKYLSPNNKTKFFYLSCLTLPLDIIIPYKLAQKITDKSKLEEKVFSEFIENWQEYKKYTPTELHFFFDTIYTNYQTTEHKKEYLALVAHNSIKSLHVIIKTIQQKEPYLVKLAPTKQSWCNWF